jgi:N-methylhydantoinase A
VTIERGRDPRDFILVAFGGSGPVHACDVAAALDIRRVLVPVSPGVFTAVGMLASDVEHHFVRAAGGLLDGARLVPGNARLDELEMVARAELAGEGYTGEGVRLECQADLRYVGQASELVIPIPGGRFHAERIAELRAAFNREYAATYGYASEDEAIELVNVRVIATGLVSHRLDFRAARVATAGPPPSHRSVAFDRKSGPVDTPVWPREAVSAEGVSGPAGGTLGPLIVESYDSTVVIPPGALVRRDELDNLEITWP